MIIVQQTVLKARLPMRMEFKPRITVFKMDFLLERPQYFALDGSTTEHRTISYYDRRGVN